MRAKITSGLCAINRLQKKLGSSSNSFMLRVKYYAIVVEMEILHDGPRYTGEFVPTSFQPYIRGLWKKLKNRKDIRRKELFDIYLKVTDLVIYLIMLQIKYE
jgi:hypothetical protein